MYLASLKSTGAPDKQFIMKKNQVCNYVDITQVQYKINNSEGDHSWPPLQDRGAELFSVEKIHNRDLHCDILCRASVLPSTESVEEIPLSPNLFPHFIILEKPI